MEIIIREIFGVLLLLSVAVTSGGFAVALALLIEELWSTIRDRKE
tara:strand:+ start:1379 stop:1513 length:135 start_codon:yes stop_codon:yes gene_type:complete